MHSTLRCRKPAYHFQVLGSRPRGCILQLLKSPWENSTHPQAPARKSRIPQVLAAAAGPSTHLMRASCAIGLRLPIFRLSQVTSEALRSNQVIASVNVIPVLGEVAATDRTYANHSGPMPGPTEGKTNPPFAGRIGLHIGNMDGRSCLTDVSH